MSNPIKTFLGKIFFAFDRQRKCTKIYSPILPISKSKFQISKYLTGSPGLQHQALWLTRISNYKDYLSSNGQAKDGNSKVGI